MSYHIRKIESGAYGELSKIREEFEEALDAEEQNNKIMVLLELSDIVGAIEGYLKNKHSSTTLDDLRVMSNATKRAFLSGARKSKN